MRNLCCFLFALAFSAVSVVSVGASAAPRVVADIAPTYGLVARVMAGVGTPDLATPQGVSPHGYRMRPSDARRLAEADIVFWLGPALTPWLERYVDGLAARALAVELLEAPGLKLAPLGEAEAEAADEKGEEPSGHGHDAHDDDAHDDDAHHDDAHHDHDHEGGFDPHVWLDPVAGAVLAAEIARTLVAADPENADRYNANLAEALEELKAVEGEINALLAPVRARPYAVQHDAYGYFERRFGLRAAGALRTGDAHAPGAARLRATRNAMAAEGVVCLFLDAGEPTKLADAATEGLEIKRATLDPSARFLSLGPDTHLALLRALAETMRACLGE